MKLKTRTYLQQITSLSALLLAMLGSMLPASRLVGAGNSRVEESRTADACRATDLCVMPGGYAVGSVAWSPKGDRVALIAARSKDDTDAGLTSNSIWVQSVTGGGSRAKPKRLATLTREESSGGIATILFWLDNDRIGWATQHGTGYTFMQMGVRDSKSKRLTNRRFSGVPCSDSVGGSAPGDVHFDANSRTIIFSGSLAPTGAYVRVLELASGDVRSLTVPHPRGLSYPQGFVDAVTVCGSLSNRKKPVFYIAAWAMSNKYEESGCYLWRSDSYALKQDKQMVTRQHQPIAWPRTSPDGKRLAYVCGGHLVLRDLASGKQNVLAERVSTDSPAAGWCPYCWSPDGKKIAYADGPKVKVITAVEH